MPHASNIIELDVFRGKHHGLVIAEVKFKDEQSLHAFQAPTFFGKEIDGIEQLAGWVLYGMNYEELKLFL
ncbi:MAG: hypothetical protein IPJ89_05115 [Candidatus Iainarchaeum archaeon]|uniref:Uncharacterized protein n=1 Tax=Candidatus Iainarchaeum sp. TaxID=3101447 RepID=A0A7T9I295_9ARCH|nr:MAG: hypothetical protein IPJ89_05115 [Candidatus Diapherotrites archaeon]